MARKKKQYSGFKTTPPKNIEIKEIIKETKEDFGVRQEKRYIIIDSETGKIFDDAQGYGYKSKRSAIAKYAYASKSKEELQNIEKDKLDVQKFWGMHKGLGNTVSAMVLDNAKCGEKFVAKDLKEVMIEYNITLPEGLTYEKLLKYW